MDAYQLFTEAGTATRVWVCGKCHHLRGGSAERADGREEAESCCRPKCCPDCGAELPPLRSGWIRCSSCQGKRDQAQTLARQAAAETVADWDGWVYWDGHGTNDGFFESLDELLDWHADEVDDHEDAAPLPEFVFCCRTIPFRKVDVGDIKERCVEDSFDGAEAQLQGLTELAAALEAFNAANVLLVSYEPDWKRVVRVPLEVTP